MLRMSYFSDLIGIIGAIIILVTYFLSQFGNWHSDTLKFLFGNLLGSALLIYSLLYNMNIGSMVIEIVWIAISIAGVWRVMRKKPADSPTIISKK